LGQLQEIEARVNAVLLDDLPVSAEVMTQDQAREIGAMALFGEKYGNAVRVVSVGDWARELCGGTHTPRTSQLGVVKLLGEASIGSGVRRVEALVGADAYSFLAREHAIVGQLTEALKARRRSCPSGSAASLPSCATPNARSPPRVSSRLSRSLRGSSRRHGRSGRSDW
jgi:alanyl-tRNA synthetase